ncbi:MAG: hypothetical protein CMJ14_01665 [Pelagibacterales bacterium]|nr:hypothetical protein [Pelagibacterales bacterium]|tara:strand:- start:2040 stop:2282 length:243 start_codon:yes stop_codon:yes gene_type:complete
MPIKYKIILSCLVMLVGFSVIIYYNPDISRVAILYDYYLLPLSLMFKKYGNVGIIILVQILMIIGLWVFPEAKGKVSVKS